MLVAWVGGQAALGAFAARIVFRDLPRELAAPTMNAVFRSFDHLLGIAVMLFSLCLAVRTWLVPKDRVTVGIGAFIAAIGLFEVLYVHPHIEQMFLAGRTLEPAFRTLHGLSEKCGHLEAIGTAAFLIALFWPRATTTE